MDTQMLTNMMGAMGRKGDTMVAHLTPGDVIIPRDIVLNNPEFLTKFKKAMQTEQSDYRTHIAGSGYENINPETGAPEFGWLKKAWKFATRPVSQVSKGISKGNIGDVIVAGAAPQVQQMLGGYLGASQEGMSMTPQQIAEANGTNNAPAPAPNVWATGTGPNTTPIDQPITPKRPNEPTKPYDLFNSSVGGQSFGSLDPMQQRTYLATQGSQGGGIGDEEKNYYLQLLQRNLIDESGQLGNMNQALMPVERNYLSRLGLPTDNTADFFKYLQT